MLVVQCDSGDFSFNLLSCARHLLEERRRMEWPDSDPIHIAVVIQLPRVGGGCPNFVGYQGQRWWSVHIDEICPPSENMAPIESIANRSLSELFEDAPEGVGDSVMLVDVSELLLGSVQAASRRIDDDSTTMNRATKRIELLLDLLQDRKRVAGTYSIHCMEFRLSADLFPYLFFLIVFASLCFFLLLCFPFTAKIGPLP